MLETKNLKAEICSLFEVYDDEGGVQRIVTPLEYSGSGENIVVRVRPSNDGKSFEIDENGESAFYANLNGGDVDSDAVERWSEGLNELALLQFTDDETIVARTNDKRLIAPYIFRVAEAAQKLHAIATSRLDRQPNDLKERVKKIVESVAIELKLSVKNDFELPIAGGFKADHVIGDQAPLIIISATTPTRLLEAELIYSRYRLQKLSGFILAIAESQASIGKKNFERAPYYTDKTVIFDSGALGALLNSQMTAHSH